MESTFSNTQVANLTVASLEEALLRFLDSRKPTITLNGVAYGLRTNRFLPDGYYSLWKDGECVGWLSPEKDGDGMMAIFFNSHGSHKDE